MKLKLFASTLVTVSSLSAMAVPADTDSLMKALFNGGKLAEVVSNEKNVAEVKVSRVDNFRNDSSIESLCGSDVNSRSASVLSAEVIYGGGGVDMVAAVYSSTHYFVTRGNAQSLKICDGQN